MQQGSLWSDDDAPTLTEDEALVALSLVPNVGAWRLRTLIGRFGSAARTLAAPYAALRAVPGIGDTTAQALASFNDWEQVRHQFETAQKEGAQLVLPGSPAYPALLREIYDPPVYLWAKGNVDALSGPAVAIVGTRRATEYGKRAAHDFAAALAEAGIVVVSGLAYGIDLAAHEGALSVGGKTVAVLGSGVNVIYPARHGRVAERITENGAVVSEFAMDAAPDAPHFPRRNRIVSGMTLGTLVVEAFPSGGALITARLAIEQNREVFALPSPIYSAPGGGTNALIRDSQAQLVTSPHEIIEALGLNVDSGSETRPEPDVELNPQERRLFDALAAGPVHIDKLCIDLDLDPSTALVTLLGLEFKGLVRQLAGKQFFRT